MKKYIVFLMATLFFQDLLATQQAEDEACEGRYSLPVLAKVQTILESFPLAYLQDNPLAWGDELLLKESFRSDLCKGDFVVSALILGFKYFPPLLCLAPRSKTNLVLLFVGLPQDDRKAVFASLMQAFRNRPRSYFSAFLREAPLAILMLEKEKRGQVAQGIFSFFPAETPATTLFYLVVESGFLNKKVYENLKYLAIFGRPKNLENAWESYPVLPLIAYWYSAGNQWNRESRLASVVGIVRKSEFHMTLKRFQEILTSNIS